MSITLHYLKREIFSNNFKLYFTLTLTKYLGTQDRISTFVLELFDLRAACNNFSVFFPFQKGTCFLEILHRHHGNLFIQFLYCL